MPDKELLPALLGGQPVRQEPFASRPQVDEREVEAVSQSLRQGLFSRFVGSPLPTTRAELRRTSAELEHLDSAFSFLGGPNVRRFEAAWARLHQTPYAIAVNSATSGITTALMALDVGPGDEVITTPLSFTATATAVVMANAVPVFADIDPETMCLSPESVEKAITPNTKCIMPVHWGGNAGDFDRIMEIADKHGIYVLEDSAQAPGTTYQGRYLGSFGKAGIFSFSEPKNVMTGEGGMIITADADLAEKCRLIRNHGESIPLTEDSDDFAVNVVGCNFRMVEASAAIGWVQTAKLPELNRLRNRNYHYLAPRLLAAAGDCLLPTRLTNPESYAAYTGIFRWREEASGVSRDTVATALRAEGIPVATGVSRLMSDNILFQRKLAFGRGGHPFCLDSRHRELDYSPATLPRAHLAQDSQYLGFFLFGHPNGTADMDHIVRAFEKIVAYREELSKFRPDGKVQALSVPQLRK